MTSTAPWEAYVSRHPVYIRGAFENEHGERYLIYRNMNGSYPGEKLYVTGDELDWQPKIPLIDNSDLIFSDEEAVIIGRILFQLGALMIEPQACLVGAHARILRKYLDSTDVPDGESSLAYLETALKNAHYPDIKQATKRVRLAFSSLMEHLSKVAPTFS